MPVRYDAAGHCGMLLRMLHSTCRSKFAGDGQHTLHANKQQIHVRSFLQQLLIHTAHECILGQYATSTCSTSPVAVPQYTYWSTASTAKQVKQRLS